MFLPFRQASLVAQTVKNPPTMQETLVQSLGWEDTLEKGMVSPLQYSYLENLMDRGAWWATVHEVTESDMTERLMHSTLGFQIPIKIEPSLLVSVCKFPLT